MSDPHTNAKHAGDVLAAIAGIASALQMLTPLFGLVACIWTLMRIAEMVSGKSFHELIRKRRDE